MVAVGAIRRQSGTSEAPTGTPISVLIELEPAERGPARVYTALMLMGAGRGAREWFSADRTEPGTVGATKNRVRQGQDQRIAGPAAKVELTTDHIGTDQLPVRVPFFAVSARRLIDLARIDFNGDGGLFQAAHAGAGDLAGETQAQCVAGDGARGVEANRHRVGNDNVGVATDLDLTDLRNGLMSPRLPGEQTEAIEVDRAVKSWSHTMSLGMCPSLHQDAADGDPYLAAIRAEIPDYDELQAAAIAAIPTAPKRVLELGIGTGETSRRLLQAFPEALVTGLDSSPDMVFRAREQIADVRLARMQDPLPDGPWDLVIAVLSVNQLDSAQTEDLFRRVKEQSRSLVIADRFGAAAPRLAQLCGGEITWSQTDLAVIRADYR